MARHQFFEQAYQRLNAEQRAAVETIEGPVMVLAGPGTGKTQILAMRVGRILQETHMDPENILCLTFTEAAAREMRERLVGLIGRAAYEISIFTFHSLGNALMQEFPEKFSGARERQPLTEWERLQIFQEILDELPGPSALKPLSNPYLLVSALSAAVRSLKQEGMAVAQYQQLTAQLKSFVKKAQPAVDSFGVLTPAARTAAKCRALQKKLLAAAADYGAVTEQLVALWAEQAVETDSKARTRWKQRLQPWFRQLKRQAAEAPAVGFVYERYQEQLQQRGRYDYEDMILLVLEQLQNDDEFRAEVQERWQYVLVDEYQDTNGAQNELLFLLAQGQENPNVFVVGDDQQSIFRFQGASLENLLTFHNQYATGLSLITLKNNYRSPQALLDAAWQVLQPEIGHMWPRPALVATRQEPRAVPLKLSAYADEMSEDYGVGRQIQQLLTAGVPAPEIAVLYRYHADAASLTTVLRQLGVAFQLEGNENVLTERRVQQLLTLWHYLAEPDRDDYLASLLNFDWWRFDSLAVMQALHAAGTKRQPLLAVLSQDRRWQPWLARVAGWRQLSQNETLPNLLARVVQESGLWQVADVNAIYQINRLLAEVGRFARAEPVLRLPALLRRLAVMQEHALPLEAPIPTTQPAGVRLMTAHRAKGLEFEHVFIIRLSDSHWGNNRRRRRELLLPGVVRHVPLAAHAAEERRLFYVAMTRAKQRLYLSYARQDDRGRGQVASRFLAGLSIGEEAAEAVPTTGLATATGRQPAAEVRGWLAAILPHYAMSVTHLNAYLKCPRLFYYRHLLRLPEFKPAHLTFGTAVHAALRDLMAHWGRTAVNKKWLWQCYERHVRRAVLTEAMQQDLLVLGRAVLGEYFDHYRATFRAGALAEYSFGPHQVRLGDLKLTGLVDKIEITDTKRQMAKVVDYKTGNPDTKAAALKHGGDYWRQLVFYKLLADRSERFPYTVRHGEIDFVEPSKRSGKFVRKEYELTDHDVQKVEEQVKSVWADIKALKFLEAAGCGECHYCRMLQ